jgi:hypothetical protein
MEKLTYKDFKIGQKVTCLKTCHEGNNDDFYEQHLTVGKVYKIEDVDFHFPEKIVVRSDNNKVSMFMPIEFFTDVKYMRKLKLDKIKKSQK